VLDCWGAVRDYFMGKFRSLDYDIFFPNEEEYEKVKQWLIDGDGEIKWDSDYGTKIIYGGHTFDLVKKFWSTPQETIEGFDFTVSMFAVDQSNVYHGESTFIDLSRRQLMFNKITYPGSSMKRAFRYYEKGFKMCGGEQTKLFMAVRYSKPDQESAPISTPNTIVDSLFRNGDASRRPMPLDWNTSSGAFAGID